MNGIDHNEEISYQPPPLNCSADVKVLLLPLCPQAVPVSSPVLHGTEAGPAGDGRHRCQLACVPASS